MLFKKEEQVEDGWRRIGGREGEGRMGCIKRATRWLGGRELVARVERRS